MTDYIATDLELTSIADAIRTAGDTSAQLEFPTGFVSAIGNLGGGGASGYIDVTDQLTLSRQLGEHEEILMLRNGEKMIFLTAKQGTLSSLTITAPFYVRRTTLFETGGASSWEPDSEFTKTITLQYGGMQACYGFISDVFAYLAFDSTNQIAFCKPAGSEVTVTIPQEEGYVYGAIGRSSSEVIWVTLTQEGGTGSFTMPNEDIEFFLMTEDEYNEMFG